MSVETLRRERVKRAQAIAHAAQSYEIGASRPYLSGLSQTNRMMQSMQTAIDERQQQVNDERPLIPRQSLQFQPSG